MLSSARAAPTALVIFSLNSSYFFLFKRSFARKGLPGNSPSLTFSAIYS
jgi:hypothetical protein